MNGGAGAGLTSVEAVFEVLLFVFGSGSSAVMVAVLTTVPLNDEATLALMITDVITLRPRLDRFQVTN